jgi:hypothetical protein
MGPRAKRFVQRQVEKTRSLTYGTDLALPQTRPLEGMREMILA